MTRESNATLWNNRSSKTNWKSINSVWELMVCMEAILIKNWRPKIWKLKISLNRSSNSSKKTTWSDKTELMSARCLQWMVMIRCIKINMIQTKWHKNKCKCKLKWMVCNIQTTKCNRIWEEWILEWMIKWKKSSNRCLQILNLKLHQPKLSKFQQNRHQQKQENNLKLKWKEKNLQSENF